MLKSKYLYGVSTGLLALFMLASGVLYFTAESAAANFERLGFPDYFRIEVGVAKIVGALALVVPLPRALKEWTYAGFAIRPDVSRHERSEGLQVIPLRC